MRPRSASGSRRCAPTRRSCLRSRSKTACADMRRAPPGFLALAALALLAGCAVRQDALRAPALPSQARLDPGRFVVITVRNEPEPAIATPGSTPRGYAAAGVYGVSATARAITRSL